MLAIRMKKNRLELSLQVLLWAFKFLQITFFILIICMCICVVLMYFWFLPGCSQFIVLAFCHKGWDELHWPGPPLPCGLQDPGADPICAGHPVRIWSLEHCCCGRVTKAGSSPVPQHPDACQQRICFVHCFTHSFKNLIPLVLFC